MPDHEFTCYNLPFGALGFISHVLTYYTLVCLWYGRKPLWPFKKVDNTKLDLILGGIGVSVCIIMSIFTMINCKNTWQLLVIAIWKMSMSLLNGLTALHVAILIVHNNDMEKAMEEMRERRSSEDVVEASEAAPEVENVEEPRPVAIIQSKKAIWWVLLYLPGMIAGMAGLMNLVVKVGNRMPDVVRLTIAFYFIVGAGLLVGFAAALIICWQGGGAPLKVAVTGFASAVVMFIVLGAFYSDWCLGLMLDNLLGTPSSDTSAFYWTYFVAKRLTMFSL
ncbi:hypothetical protein CVT24_007200 [Panaeolus cyanescens]|uniref:Uncharacterized protein n=1 Tax=Panaeolus cyanescens TaxID=181874 RepID=A0A409VJI7_9AGAR|nr:hypothetical protein CVT24_007200 [Panaeolus cyanescens]